jgi:uncharacterized protein YcsI (UPF0317 family)
MNTELQAPIADDPRVVRLAIRSGWRPAHTAGIARGFVQANVVILERAMAGDFLRYCTRNPKPCPVLAVAEPGDARLPTLGYDLDIRTDLPRYRVWRHGELVDQPADISALWRDDLVTFALGCSFSFEKALLEAGVRLRHIVEGRNVAMFRTSIDTVPAGPFRGPLIVSMRPLRAADAIRAVEITSRYSSVHGAPIHIGDPGLIGISDLSRPDEGDPIAVMPEEIPVFWACGVTPQAAIAAARPALCITHFPGAMLITDMRDYQLADS